MHGVIETPTFLRDAAEADLSEDERLAIVDSIANNPIQGDLMKETGGVRKVRFAGRGKGKSGGYRIVTYFAAQDIPVLMLTVFGKGDKDNLSKAERNALKMDLGQFAEKYRAGVRQKIAEMKRREP